MNTLQNFNLKHFIERIPMLVMIFLIIAVPPVFTPIYFYPKLVGTRYSKIIYLALIFISAGLMNYILNKLIFK
jgi:hypothetical protein